MSPRVEEKQIELDLGAAGQQRPAEDRAGRSE